MYRGLSVFLFLLFISPLVSACDHGQAAPATPPLIITGPSPSHPLSFTPIITQDDAPTETLSTSSCSLAVAEYCIVTGTFLLQRPIASPWTFTIDRAYPYGSTAGGTRLPHHGVEFYNGSGTPVLATAEGSVFYTGDDSSRMFATELNYYGNLVILEHHLAGKTLYTLYAHLSTIVVVTGQEVHAGDKIAEVGASGAAIGSHLHFEVRLDPQEVASTLNPELWLEPVPGTGTLSVRYTNSAGQFLQIQPNIQYYPDPTGLPLQSWQPETYDPRILSVDVWENLVLGDLPAGTYRLTHIWAGVVYERWVEIQPGKLTITAFELP